MAPLVGLAALTLSTLASAATIQCPLVFDGRIPSSLQPAAFDTAGSGSPFIPNNVKGNGLLWSDILLFPDVVPSRFDRDGGPYKPVEVTISDKSIFKTQNGFRRAGLIFNGDPNTGSPGYVGTRTFHWSVRQDESRPLNLTHEYLNSWHEASDYSSNQFQFQAGLMIDQPSLPRNTFKILNRQNKLLWSAPVEHELWQNFALQFDVGNNTLQIYYSTGDEPLAVAAPALSADMSGGGQFQIGILKKPTGTKDVVNAGFQEKDLNEGQIYGGIFVEDSTGGCISL